MSFDIKDAKKVSDLYDDTSPRLAVENEPGSMTYDDWGRAGFQFAENMWEMSWSLNDMLKQHGLEIIEVHDQSSDQLGFRIQPLGGDQ